MLSILAIARVTKLKGLVTGPGLSGLGLESWMFVSSLLVVTSAWVCMEYW
jgi:hypothetical protein